MSSHGSAALSNVNPGYIARYEFNEVIYAAKKLPAVGNTPLPHCRHYDH